MATREEILVLAKAYPNISTKHGEIVCTAGITRDGRWLRIYPMPYRELPFEKRYKKFQWIKIDVLPSNEKLQRPESRKVADLNSLELLAEIPSRPKGWKEREALFMPHVCKSLEELEERKESISTSLGIFRPKEVTEFVIERSEEHTSEKKKKVLNQGKLFGIQQTPLAKVPYKFSYRFVCDDDRCRGHKIMILDWEMGESYWNFKRMYKTEAMTLDMLRDKWLDNFFRRRESYFVMGTESEFNKFMVLTVLSPRRKP